MNLVVPVNLQALRVTPNDASLITKQPRLFSGPTTSFDQLPWRDLEYKEHPGRISNANVSANVVNPLSGNVVEQLDAGIHLHWVLPDGLTRGVQRPDGSLAFPAVPNRWLVSRILNRGGHTETKQWVVESDRLITEDDYVRTYYPETRRRAVAIPVGWSLVDGHDPQTDGGALYYPPSRRIGRAFELAGWQPVASAPGSSPDQVLHLDELERQANAFAQGTPPGPLKAVGASGPAFAAYYPDCVSLFGFHDRFDDLAGADLGKVTFEVSYVVVGWHSHATDDPLRSATFSESMARASAANAAAPEADRVDPPRLTASTVLGAYGWHYDPATGTPDRALYSAQLVGLAWDTTGGNPTGDPKYPQCFLQPLANDPTVRLAVGNSPSSAMAALVRHEWTEWVSSAWSPADGQAPDIDAQIEQDLELLLDALQLGQLHRLGTSGSLPQLEQVLHQSGFASLQGGRLWTIQVKGTDSDKTDPHRFDPPDAVLPADDDGHDVGGKLTALNDCQTRLDALLLTAESASRQIYSDWYHYINSVGSDDADSETNALINDLKGYVSRQILDLWTTLDAAFGMQVTPGPGTANLPQFFSGPNDYLVLRDGRYATASPPTSLSGQIAAAANALLDVLGTETYAGFELQRVERPRFWQPNEPVVVATGDSLKPAQRNGTAKYLPCRLSTQLLRALQATSGANQASLVAEDAAAALSLATPELTANQTPEAADTQPLLGDVGALIGEACLLDATLAPVLAGKLGVGAEVVPSTDLRTALKEVTRRIARAWQTGVPESATLSMPAIVSDPSATVGAQRISLPGQAPQGVGLTVQTGDSWEDPFLPLFLVWELSYQAFEKGAVAGCPRYDPKIVTDRFALDENAVELVLNGKAPPTQGGAATLRGFVPLSSRASEPLLDRIREYLDGEPEENRQLQAVIDHLSGKPLLSQGLSGINPALLSRSQGMQLVVFNPFFDAEAPATALSADHDTLNYANVLTHFVGAVAAGAADQVPLGEAGFNPLRSGYVKVMRAHVVDAFGRKRPVIDSGVAADADKVVACAQLQPPAGVKTQVGLPPRLAQPARLLFEWVSGNDAGSVTNAHPSTSPVTGWVVSNHLDNSLMLFAPSGGPLGSLGVFGGQETITWESPPGNPARSMGEDLAGLDHLLKFATFLRGQSRTFFDALTASIENAHTYILPETGGGDQPYAVLMGRPLALVRAELRLELAGLPAFDSGLDAVRAAMAANAKGPYDWTRRDDAGLLDVDLPVRLGDRNHLSDGLVAYLIDGPEAYDTIFAPAAEQTDGTGVRRPGPDTLRLTPRPALDPPDIAHPAPADQIAALQDATQRPVGKAVTLLIDPRAGVHAATGILPVKEITLPAETYARALQAIEVAFATRPVLRGAQALELPIPDEAGFVWRWTVGVKQNGGARPTDEDLRAPTTGDRALFNFSPQVAQDGWLKLVAQPPSEET